MSIQIRCDRKSNRSRRNRATSNAALASAQTNSVHAASDAIPAPPPVSAPTSRKLAIEATTVSSSA
jgi:hypothetical protein